jgi:hypothetical protein
MMLSAGARTRSGAPARKSERWGGVSAVGALRPTTDWLSMTYRHAHTASKALVTPGGYRPGAGAA